MMRIALRLGVAKNDAYWGCRSRYQSRSREVGSADLAGVKAGEQVAVAGCHPGEGRREVELK